jgi:outer membrane protein assembly factor BamB
VKLPGFRVSAAACLAAAVPVLAAPAETAMFRVDARHSGVSAGPAGPAFAGVRWKFAARGPVRGSPVVAGDLVLVGSGDGNLYALETSTGRERWRAPLGGAVASTPAVAGGLVFVTSRERRVTALELSTGRERWRFEAGPDLPFQWGWDFWLSSPAVADGRVFVGSGDGNLYALDAKSGRKLWEVPTAARVRSSPAVAGGVVFVGSMSGRLHAVDAASGSPVWAFDTEGVSIDSKAAGFDRTSIVSSPAVGDDLVFVGSRDAHLYAVDRRTGEKRWRFGHKIDDMEGTPEVSWVLGSPALTNGLVLVGSSDGRFFDALREGSGEEIWRFRTPGNVLSSGTVAGGVVFFGCEDGHLFALDAASGHELWRFRTGGAVISTPAVAGGAVYFGSDDGTLYALATGPAPAGARPRRAVYWKDGGDHRWFKGAAALKDYLREEGYELLDDDGLSKLLADLPGAPRSVVVVSADALPASAFAEPPEESPFRRYLAAGGRVVWLSLPPDSIERDPKTGKAVRFDPSRSTRLLGVEQQAGNVDWMGATATPDGRRWGMPDWYLAGWAVPKDQVTTALAIDEWGLASAWVKSFGSVPGSGFVRVWGRADPIPDPSWVRAVAEHAE